MGKLHRERVVTRRIFQTLPTQIDTTTVTFSSVTENDLLWAGVCLDHPALPLPCLALPCLSPQTDTMFAFIYKMVIELTAIREVPKRGTNFI